LAHSYNPRKIRLRCLSKHIRGFEELNVRSKSSVLPECSAEQSKSRLGCIFWFGIAVQTRATFALFRQDIFEFAVMDSIDAYAMVSADLIS
jgi:hypothetical protein